MTVPAEEAVDGPPINVTKLLKRRPFTRIVAACVQHHAPPGGGEVTAGWRVEVRRRIDFDHARCYEIGQWPPATGNAYAIGSMVTRKWP